MVDHGAEMKFAGVEHNVFYPERFGHVMTLWVTEGGQWVWSRTREDHGNFTCIETAGGGARQ